MDSPSLWSDMLDKQLRLRDQNAHVIELQEQCVDEAVNRLEKAQDELEQARFNHKRAQLAHLELVQEMAARNSTPRVMYKELRKRADKVAETLRAVMNYEQRETELQKAVDDAQETLAFDRAQQARTLEELKTITEKIEQLSAIRLKS